MKYLSFSHRYRELMISLGFFCLFTLCLIGCGENEETAETLLPVIPTAGELTEKQGETIDYTNWEVPGPEELAAFQLRVEHFREELRTGKRNIPNRWPETEDPVLHAEYMRAQLLKQFGEKPQVHTFVDMQLKMDLWIPLTLDEEIAFLEAQNRLWPDPRTGASLKSKRDMVSLGVPFYMIYGDAPIPVQRKLFEYQFEKYHGTKPTEAKIDEFMSILRKDNA